MPKNIHVVMQQGGSTSEWYTHAHDTLTESRRDILSCEKASYTTVGPIKVSSALTKALLANKRAEREFYELLKEIAEGVATNC